MVCKNCGKEYFVCEKTDTYNWCKDCCSSECYSDTYKKEFKMLGYNDDFSSTLAGLAVMGSDGIKSEVDLSSVTKDLIDTFNAIGCTSFQMPTGDIHVYCTNCKHFRLDDESIPYCPYEEKECDIRNCEDGRPFRERPMYEEIINQ